MNINPQMKKMLIDEISYAVERMEKAEDPIQKLFYFSAIFGAIQRIYNIEYDADLVFAHFILLEVYKAFSARIRAITKEQDTTVPLTVEQMDKLLRLAKEFGERIEKDKSIQETLRRFVLLLYSTTGNGYYLYEKGVLKI